MLRLMRSKRSSKRLIANPRHIPDFKKVVWPDALRQRRELMNRIHYHLREKGQRLSEYKGRYVIVDLHRDVIVEGHVNVDRLARKFRVLKA
jgi:hypothetical protein